MLNVGFDFSSVVYDRGVSRYTYNLAKNLLLYHQNDLNLYLYGSSFGQYKKLESKITNLLSINKQKNNFCLQKKSISLLKFFWQVLKINKIKSIFPQINLYHSWDYLQPPDNNLCLISTVHDLALFKNKNLIHPQIYQAHLKNLNFLKKNNAHFLAASLKTKKDLIDLFQIPPFKIDVVYEAIPEEIKLISQNLSQDQYDLIKKKFNLNRPFIFFVGTREPRKNLIRAIQAWSKLQKYVDFIVAGENGWDKTEKLTHQYKNLHFLGKISDEELTVLYNEAKLLLYPSLDEGFGLPILEAFYFGTPVVTSDILALKEVAGNAAFFVNPLDVKSIYQGINKILNENSLEQKLRLQKMIIRNQKFSWQKTAKETMLVYQKAYSNYYD